MKKQKTLKAFVLSLAMAAGMLLPMTTNAQQTDGFFRGGIDNYNRDGGLSNQTFGQDVGGGPQTPTELVPLGSGLLIMMTAGAGYALLKKKED